MRTKSFKKGRNPRRAIKYGKKNTRIIGLKGKRAETLFREIIVENFSDLGKELGISVQEANRIPWYLNAQRPHPKYIMMKLSKSNERKNSKVSQEGKKSNLQRNLP